MSAPCKRCQGAGFAPVDRVEGLPHVSCHRCEGAGQEPAWTASPEAYRAEVGRVAELHDLLPETVAAWFSIWDKRAP